MKKLAIVLFIFFSGHTYSACINGFKLIAATESTIKCATIAKVKLMKGFDCSGDTVIYQQPTGKRLDCPKGLHKDSYQVGANSWNDVCYINVEDERFKNLPATKRVDFFCNSLGVIGYQVK